MRRAVDPLIDAVAQWVENGKEPESVVAPRQTPEKGIDRSFRICPEPKCAMLKAPGLDFNDAGNWECRAPGV